MSTGAGVLSASGTAATEFYRQVLDDNAVLILPGGLALDDRETIIQSMSGEPWSAYRLQDIRVLKLGIGIVA